MKVAVVDDEPLSRARLRRMLLAQGVNVMAEGRDGNDAVAIASDDSIDLIFLDVNMPNKNGIHAAIEIEREVDSPPAIVFCTAYDQYAIDAFRTNAVAYLLKPFSLDDIVNVIDKAQKLTKPQIRSLEKQKASDSDLLISSCSEKYKVPLDQIIYFYSKDKFTYARLFDGKDILVDDSLKVLEQRFSDRFIRVHRAYLVSKPAINRISRAKDGGWELTLNSNEQENLTISRRLLGEVRACFES